MHTISKLIGATALLAVSLASQASSVAYTVDSGKLIALHGLVVDGISYTVSFVSGPYSILSGSSIFQTESGAANAATALVDALNDPNAAPTGVQSDPSKVYGLTDPGFSAIFVPGIFGGNGNPYYTEDAARSSNASDWFNVETFNLSIDDFDTTKQPQFIWAKFTVPIPAAIWMTGSALVGLIGFVRRASPSP